MTPEVQTTINQRVAQTLGQQQIDLIAAQAQIEQLLKELEAQAYDMLDPQG